MIKKSVGQDHIVNSLNNSIASLDIFKNNLGLHKIEGAKQGLVGDELFFFRGNSLFSTYFVMVAFQIARA
jgi:hypothetical protein